MTVYLCGASGSETGGITGAAGDQTGREVRKTPWYRYSGGWTYVLRAQDPTKAERIAQAAEQGAANNRIGYDQSNRNDLLKKLERYGTMKAIAVNTECDCTSFAACCMIQAGFPKSKLYVNYNLPYSKNFDVRALACGGIDKLTQTSYLSTPNYLKRGDILVAYGHHAEVVVTNGSKAIEKEDDFMSDKQYNDVLSKLNKILSQVNRIVEPHKDNPTGDSGKLYTRDQIDRIDVKVQAMEKRLDAIERKL